MSQVDFFPTEAAILCTPAWYSTKAYEVQQLPLTPGDYKITPGERWPVTLLKTGETIYHEIGPVKIHRS